MAAISWKNNAGGNWNTGANWSSGTVPGSGDDVTVSTSSAQTITYGSGSDTILSLYFATADTLAMSGGALSVLGNTSFYGNLAQSAGSLRLGGGVSTLAGTITQTGGTLTATSGTLFISGSSNSFAGALSGTTIDFNGGSDNILAGTTLKLAQFQLSGASIAVAENLTQSGTWLESSGTLSLGSNTLTLSGPTALDGGIMTGTGQVLLSGNTEISGSFAAEGQLGFVNAGTITQTGYFYLGAAGTDTATLTNQAGATYRIDGDSTIAGSVGDKLTNAGLLIKSSGGGTAQINANTASTGTITVASGVLRFEGATDSFAGAINGAGALALTAGAASLASGVSVTVGTLLLDGATVNLGGALSYGGVLEQNAGTLALGSNTMTLSGGAALDGGALAGTGTLAVSGATDFNGYFLTGGSVLKNSGTLTQSGTNYVGYFGSDTAQFDNLAGATWLIDGSSTLYGATGAKISNAGTLVKATGSGAAYIADSFSNTGSIAVDSGLLRFNGGTNSFGGIISGAGVLDLTGLADTFAKGVKLTVANVLLESGVLTIASKLSYAGAFSQTGGTLSLGSQAFTLTGSAQLDNGSASGSGKLSIKNADLGSYALTGSVAATNTGTTNIVGSFYDGYYTGDTASFTNAVKAVLSIQGNNIIYGTTGSTLTNAGTLIKANGAGISSINVSTASTGTVTVNSGDLRFSGGTNSFAGTVGGAGTFELNTGADSFASGLKLTVGTVLLDGASVTLGGAMTQTDAFEVTAGTLNLGGTALTLSHASFDGGTTTGSGTLSLSGTTGFSQTIFSGSVVVNNGGVIDVSGTTYIGYNSSDTVQLNNLAGATLKLEDNAVLYGSAGSLVSNAGTLVKSGAGTGVVYDAFTSTGSIAVASGVLRLSGATENLSGAIGGAGTLELNTGAVGLGKSLSLTVAGMLLDGASVSVTSALSYAHAWSQSAGTLSLSGATLSLSGQDALGAAIVTGSGTLAIAGTEAITGGGALEGSVVLSNSGTIAQTGYLYVGYNTSDTAVLQNNTGGVIHIENGAIIYGVASSSIDNAGSIVKTGSAQTNINVAVSNIGSIELGQGTMDFLGPVSGAGTITADAGTTLLFGGAVAAGGAVFLGADVLLSVNATAGFGDTIHGFAAGDLIDLGNLGYGAVNTLTYNSAHDTIAISNGSASVTLTLAGSYSQGSFQLIDDRGIVGVLHS